jgi:hypothetical protein
MLLITISPISLSPTQPFSELLLQSVAFTKWYSLQKRIGYLPQCPFPTYASFTTFSFLSSSIITLEADHLIYLIFMRRFQSALFDAPGFWFVLKVLGLLWHFS